MRRISLGAVFVAAAIGIASCGGGGAQTGGNGGGDTGSESKFDLVQSGTLTVCSDVPYPPMEMETDNGYTGFDIELITAIAKELDLDVTVKDVGFEALQSGTTLAADTCDIAVSSMTITEEREKNLDFSNAYFDADQSLLVPKDSSISGIEDLAGKTVGVQQGTTGQDYTEENAPDNAKIVSYPSDAELSSALAAGRIDGILQDIPPNQSHVDSGNPVPSKIVATFQTNEHYGFAVAEKGSDKLLKAVNKALETVRSNGTYDKLYNKYFSTESGGSESS